MNIIATVRSAVIAVGLLPLLGRLPSLLGDRLLFWQLVSIRQRWIDLGRIAMRTFGSWLTPLDKEPNQFYE